MILFNSAFLLQCLQCIYASFLCYLKTKKEKINFSIYIRLCVTSSYRSTLNSPKRNCSVKGEAQFKPDRRRQCVLQGGCSDRSPTEDSRERLQRNLKIRISLALMKRLSEVCSANLH